MVKKIIKLHLSWWAFTRIVGCETNGDPSSSRESDCAPTIWILQVEILRVCMGVVVAKSWPNNIEIVSMQVEWVVIQKEHIQVL